MGFKLPQPQRGRAARLDLHLVHAGQQIGADGRVEEVRGAPVAQDDPGGDRESEQAETAYEKDVRPGCSRRGTRAQKG